MVFAMPGYGEDIAPSGLWTRSSLTGDWGGARTTLMDRGVTLGVSEVAEVFGNATGGQKTGTVFTGRAEFDLDFDLEKLAGWSGAVVHVNAFQIHGRGLTNDTLGGNLLDPSNIEAHRSTRLFDAYLEQNLFDAMLSIRIGQIAADDEFQISDYGAALINGTFGWTALMAADLPGGGPGYPLATPGMRVKWKPSDAFYWQTAIFNGDPGGHCSGDPQICNNDGLTFATDRNAFVISELGYSLTGKFPATFKLGGWYHSGSFADLQYDVDGGLAGATGETAYLHRNNYGAYAMIDAFLWRETDGQGLAGFFHIGAAPGDRNLVPFYFDTGLQYTGLIETRDSDIFALGFAFAKISDRARDRDQDYNEAHPSAIRPVRDYEAAIELSYSYVAAPWWTIQPDIQYILHPAGLSASPTTAPDRPAPAMKDAFVFGIRTAIQL